MVYTKTIVLFSVGESGGYLPRSVNNCWLFFIKQNIKDAAVEEYKKATKKNTEVTIDEQAFLGSDW